MNLSERQSLFIDHARTSLKATAKTKITEAFGVSNRANVVEGGIFIATTNLENFSPRGQYDSLMVVCSLRFPPQDEIYFAVLIKSDIASLFARLENMLNAEKRNKKDDLAYADRNNNTRLYLANNGLLYLRNKMYWESLNVEMEAYGPSVRIDSIAVAVYPPSPSQTAETFTEYLTDMIDANSVHEIQAWPGEGWRLPKVSEPGTDGVEVEEELEDSSVPLEPAEFKANDVRVMTKQLSIDLIVSRIKYSELELMPDFQRAGGIWNDVAQSRLIESLMIFIPIPAFYFDGTNEGRWAVIDGQQRLTAISRFINGELQLKKLEFLGDFEGLSYRQLPRHMQRRINEAQVPCYVIEKGTPEKVKLIIFKRINTGGTPLSPQEIRHAINPGPARSFLKKIAESSQFVKATDDSLKVKRMVDRECVLRFMAFRLQPYENYSGGDLDYFLNETMKKINLMSNPERAKLEQEFYNIMDYAHRIFGKKAFRKQFKGTRRSAINKPLFEIWSVIFSRLDRASLESLVEKKDQLKHAFINLLETDEVFLSAITQGTMQKNKVALRFRKIEELVQGLLS